MKAGIRVSSTAIQSAKQEQRGGQAPDLVDELPVKAHKPGIRRWLRHPGGGIEQGFEAAQHPLAVDRGTGRVNRSVVTVRYRGLAGGNGRPVTARP